MNAGRPETGKETASIWYSLLVLCVCVNGDFRLALAIFLRFCAEKSRARFCNVQLNLIWYLHTPSCMHVVPANTFILLPTVPKANTRHNRVEEIEQIQRLFSQSLCNYGSLWRVEEEMDRRTDGRRLDGWTVGLVRLRPLLLWDDGNWFTDDIVYVEPDCGRKNWTSLRFMSEEKPSAERIRFSS